MGEQFCNSGKESSSWFQHWGPFITEKALNLPGSKGPEWCFGEGTIWHQQHWGNTWKIPWNDLIYNSQLQQGLLDGRNCTPQSRKLTTMALDIWRFQWTRLPMGSIIAQDVFQQKLDVIFLSVQGVTGIADDMIIFGKTDQEHDGNFLNFLEVYRKNNLILNLDKMQFRLPKVSFFGHSWSDKSLSADPKKIEAVKRMEIPSRCGNHEKLPRIDQLPQPIQSKTSWNKWPTKGNLQTESGIPAYKSLWRLPFNAARRKFPRISLFHTSTPRLRPFFKQMPPRKD